MALDEVPLGSEIRAEVTESGSERVAEFTLGDEASQVEGSLLIVGADSVVLGMWRSDVVGGAFDPGRVNVSLRRSEIVGVEEKSLSKGRTALLAAGLAAGLYLLFDGVFAGGRGGPLDGGGEAEIILIPTPPGR